jgi:hypothetical protein
MHQCHLNFGTKHSSLMFFSSTVFHLKSLAMTLPMSICLVPLRITRCYGLSYVLFGRPYNSRKLEFRSKRCVFLGYSNLHKGFKCLDPSKGRVYISRDVVFHEHVFPFSLFHPNAGARLRAKLALLPNVLKILLLILGMQFCMINR